MSAFQTAQMFSLQDPNIYNLAVEGVFDDCQDIVKAVSGDAAFKARYRIGKMCIRDRCYTEGISKLTREDIVYAEQLGYRIKLLGITKRTPDGVELRVHPTLIPARRLIANVEGVMNAVLVQGDAVGSTLYYGRGAGAEPTASAVVADLVDVTRMHTADPEHRVPHLAFQPDRLSDLPILPMAEVRTAYYLRMRVDDKPGVLADVTRILADSGISIDAMIQKQPSEGEQQTDIILLTHLTLEKQVDAAIVRIESLGSVSGRATRIRLEQLAAR